MPQRLVMAVAVVVAAAAVVVVVLAVVVLVAAAPTIGWDCSCPQPVGPRLVRAAVAGLGQALCGRPWGWGR
jgi:hypothetical protein